ncbi:peptidase domain-containing ABC transporter [soil metagenome]
MKHIIKVRQRDTTDCGAACLASVASHFGLHLSVARIRQLASTDKKGTNITGMIEASQHLGFEVKGVKGSFESLFKIPIPAVAHVIVNGTLHHFIVIYKVSTQQIEVIDPADGQMHLYSHEDFKKVWTGALIMMAPGETFKKGNFHEPVALRLWNLVSQHKLILVKALVGALLYTLIGLSTSIYVQKIIDDVLLRNNQRLLNMMGVVMVFLLLTGIFVGFGKSLLTLKTGKAIDTKLILGYYRHLLKLPQHFFDTMRVGEILSRVNDAVKIRNFINDVFINLIVNFLIIIFSVTLMFTYYWKLAAVVIIIIPTYSIIYFLTNRLNRKIERKQMENTAELESQLVESINSISTVKSFGLELDAQIKTEEKFNRLLQTVHTSGINNLSSSFSTEFVSRLFTILLLWIGAIFVMEKQITTGQLLSFYALIGYFTTPASNLIGANKIIQNALIAADRLFEIDDLKPEEEENENKISLTATMIGDIKFTGVSFRYGSRVTVFQDFNLTIPKSSIVAIIGESGSGKSTLIHILLKLYPISAGHVKIGDYDLADTDNQSLRRLIAVVPQKIDLFSGNVIDNIAIGDASPDMTKISNISKTLGILDFINGLPAGFNTYLGENGATLSGGQKQRIAIARALYRDPEILILDEATSSLDTVSEKYIHKMIELLKSQNKTVIIIAHRLASFALADKIVVIENGAVAEKGSHSELLKNQKQYYSLWQSQFPDGRL